MTWPGTLNTKTTGELVDADDWNDLVNGINFMGNTHDHSGDAGDGGTVVGLGTEDYDSGWYAVTYNTTYSKAHGLGTRPRLVMLWHSASGPGTDEWVRIGVGGSSRSQDMLGVDGTYVYDQTCTTSLYGTVDSTRRTSGGGYHRILAWA